MKTRTHSDFRQFFTGFLTCALWSSHDNSTESGGEPFDKNFSREDIAFSSLLSMARECRDFIRENADYLSAYRSEISTRGDFSEMEYAAYGSTDLYLGDDGKIYAS